MSFNDTLIARAKAMLTELSLEQKIGQMIQTERMSISPEEVRVHHIGSVLSGGGSCPGNNTPADWVEMNDAYHQAAVKSDSAIPTLYGVDAIHGHNNVRGATLFPHNIGLGCANDPELMARIGRVTAKEILATGVEWTFAPTVAVAQNMQWGRMYESYSEDPTTVSRLAAPFISALQDEGVIACAKHWVGDGGTAHGIDQGDTRIAESELREVHVFPYLAAIKAGVLTVMASFNSWYGQKLHGHHYLLTEVLKNELGFRGYIISDWDGCDYLHHDFHETVAMGVNAGIDMFMVSEKWQGFADSLRQHVIDQRVSMSRIDDAVLRILTVKLHYGLWDKPRPAERAKPYLASFGGAAHRSVAREAVQKSLVLLKNQKDLLPLSANAKILVAGKNAHDTGHQAGGFTIAWQGLSSAALAEPSPYATGIYGQQSGAAPGQVEGATSVWEAICEYSPHAVRSVDGSEATRGSYDVAVVVIGEKPYAEGMGDIRATDAIIGEESTKINGLMKVLHPYGRSLELRHLHPEDLQTLMRIANCGIPIVTVFIGGRPLVVEEELNLSDAFVAAWLPGSEGGGVADGLFGASEFTGRLSFSWPSRAPESNQKTADAPLRFHRGFGLSTSAKTSSL